MTTRFVGSRHIDVSAELLTLAIARAKAGDVTALHFLYVRFADDVYGYLASIVQDSHEAEDITQNVFAKLVTAIQKYEPQEVPFAAWIRRVSRNVALDRLRARRQIPFDEVRTDDNGLSPERSHIDSGRPRPQSTDSTIAVAARSSACWARSKPHR